ncbi:hypothetical protein AB0C29_36655 [Actinoplanes sp. NPDC048791]|uniref:hypothetical protein n=1 Tax=Actinoplanes sp. NPDC048791 TaxID=3154623 RepID=UPI0033D870B4
MGSRSKRRLRARDEKVVGASMLVTNANSAQQPATPGHIHSEAEGDQRQASTEGVAETFDQLSGWTTATLVAAIPAIVALFRILVLSNADMQVARTILGEIDIFAFLGSLALEMIRTGYASLLVFAHLIWRYTLRPPDSRNGATVRNTYLLILIFLGALAMIMTRTPLSMIIATATVFIAMFLITIAEKKGHILPGSSRIGPAALTVYLLLPMTTAFYLIADTPWMPLENIGVKGESEHRWAYVLSVNDTHTTLLSEVGGVERIPNSLVETRIICPQYILAKIGHAQGSRIQGLYPPPVVKGSKPPSDCQDALNKGK